MCLKRVKEVIKKPNKTKVITGYKYFEKFSDADRLLFPHIGGVLESNTWLRARGRAIKACDGKKYPSGFHAFASKGEASRNNSNYVVKVKLRKIVAKGHQYTFSKAICYVAKEMFVDQSKVDKIFVEREKRLRRLNGR